MIVGVVLAAGRGMRYGSLKVVAPLRGRSLVRHVVDRLREAGVDELLVVAGGDPAAVGRAVAGVARVVENPSAHLGLSSSLRAGVDALPEGTRAILVALGDQPLIDPAVVRALVSTWERSNAIAVVPVYRDGRGNPVLFDATLRAALRTLDGDAGARHLLESLGERVTRLTIDADAPRDVDTPDDLRRLEEG